MTFTTLTERQTAERDMLCRSTIGHTWDELAAAHEGACGGCRGGRMLLNDITVVTTFPGASTRVRLTLVCDQCGGTLVMPPYVREETTQP